MYSGVLLVTTDQLKETIETTNNLQMTSLKNSLVEKAMPTVTPANVISWRKFARDHNLTKLFKWCDQRFVNEFSQVVEHEEFLAMSEDEVVKYFQVCKPFADRFGQNVLLQAAIRWMSKAKRVTRCEELFHCISFEACPKSSLVQTSKCSDVPNSSQQLIKKAVQTWEQPLQNNILAFVTIDNFLVLDTSGKIRQLFTHKSLDGPTCSSAYVCQMKNGFVKILEHDILDDVDVVHCTVITASAPYFTAKIVSSNHRKPTGIHLSTYHNNRLYIVPAWDQQFIECFDVANSSWSTIRNPKPSRGCKWKSASVGEALYLMNDTPCLLCIQNDEAIEIPTKYITFVEFIEDISIETYKREMVLTAIEEVLYIFATYTKHSTHDRFTKVYWYNTQSFTWSTTGEKHECAISSSVTPLLFEEGRYILFQCSCHSDANLFCRYDVAKDAMRRSRYPCPLEICQPLMIDKSEMNVGAFYNCLIADES